MNDLIIKGTGNSRFLKSNVSLDTTLQELIEMLNNGTFPFDFNGLNPDGIEEMGTPINTATLLTDDLAIKLGLDPATATVNNAIVAIKNKMLPIDGGTMTGALYLNGDPLADLEAATKQYVDTLISNRPKLEAGEYKGTGSGGTSSKPMSLTFPFEPKMLWITGGASNSYFYACFPTLNLLTTSFTENAYICLKAANTNNKPFVRPSYLYARKDGNTIFWYSTNADGRLNDSGKTYYYVAIG